MSPSSHGTSSSVIRLSGIDNVGVARADIVPGQALGETDAAARQAIPRGHKVALADIPAGSVIVKYGQPIGVASAAIRAGEHVHLHNLSMRDDLQHLDFAGYGPAASAPRDAEPRTFAGFLRSDGHHEEPQIAAHLLASIPHSACLEVFHPDRDPLFYVLVANRVPFKEGFYKVPEGFGWGLELDEAVIARARAE